MPSVSPARRPLLTAFAIAMLWLALVVPLVPQQLVQAAPEEVVTNLNDSGVGSLRQAIIDVNDGGTITFLDGLTGTITLSDQLTIDKALTITGPGADQLTVSGNDATRVLYIEPQVRVEISGLTISGGRAAEGAGVFVDQAVLDLSDSVVTGNVATSDDQTGGLRGGGIYINAGALGIENSTIANNSAVNGAGGGIVSISFDTRITNSTISGNTATGTSADGAGIYNAGLLQVTNSTISGNTAEGSGGAIYNTTLGGFRGLQITSSTLAGNEGDVGAAIYNDDGPVGIKQTIIANTLTSNSNCAVLSPDTSPIVSLGYNLASDDSCFLTEEGDLPNTDPLLGALTDNGGPTQTHAIAGYTPAYNAGGEGPCPTPTDQRGIERPQLGACDIGAFELEVAPPPALTLPTVPITVEAAGPEGTIVHFADDTSAVDWSGAELEVDCDPASGTTFTIGTHPVECSATDDFNQKTSATFTIIVQDTTAPTLAGHEDLTVPATGPDGATVAFALTASDTVDPAPAITCIPPSGSMFEIGTTEVSCAATDTANNTSASVTFSVTVLGGDDLLPALIEDVQTSDIPAFLKPRLLIFLSTVDLALERGNTAAACHTLQTFSDQVAALSPRYITPGVADPLRDDAQVIRDALGC